MKVRDYMTEDVVFANLRDGLHQTLTRMRERGIRHMPVIGDDGALTGIVSDRDLRRPDFVDPDTNLTRPFALDNSVTVAHAMTRDPSTVAPDAPLRVALDLFIERHFGALPVVTDGEVVGILSTVDLLRAFRDHLERPSQAG